MSSTSNTSVTVLRTLHRIHRQLADLKSRLERGPKQIQAAEMNVKRCEEALEKLKAEAKAMRVDADRKQLQLKTSEDKVKELRRKLNAAESNREYQALLEQIAADEMANSVLADEILDALEKIDAFQKNVTEAEKNLTAARQKAAQIRAEVAEREPGIKADLVRLEAELKQTEALLPSEIGELYQRIIRQKGEDGLAVVDGQCCSGCYQQLQLNLLNQIMLGQPAFCKSCGRLLYLPE